MTKHCKDMTTEELEKLLARKNREYCKETSAWKLQKIAGIIHDIEQEMMRR